MIANSGCIDSKRLFQNATYKEIFQSSSIATGIKLSENRTYFISNIVELELVI